ncbi:hypothetical protein HJD18_00750 [Thermoleophilia bacterium SCSIO 60948]|nr:hypothetical protein HJD18_00750 [Thermoleophilia bacterium SCSIO 60948]
MAAKRDEDEGSAASGEGGLDATVKAVRETLDHSVTLSVERLQETVDDAVRRGRMTRDDANELVSSLVSRGRSYRDDLIGEIEALLAGARQGAQDLVDTAEKRARASAASASRTTRDLADEPLRQVDRARRAVRAPGAPITGYERLTAAQVRGRIGELSANDLRSVREQEAEGRARKTILAEIDRRLERLESV